MAIPSISCDSCGVGLPKGIDVGLGTGNGNYRLGPFAHCAIANLHPFQFFEA